LFCKPGNGIGTIFLSRVMGTAEMLFFRLDCLLDSGTKKKELVRFSLYLRVGLNRNAEGNKNMFFIFDTALKIL